MTIVRVDMIHIVNQSSDPYRTVSVECLTIVRNLWSVTNYLIGRTCGHIVNCELAVKSAERIFEPILISSRITNSITISLYVDMIHIVNHYRIATGG